MATQMKWEKTELLNLYKKNRQQKRCAIVRTLQIEADNLTKDLKQDIIKFQKLIQGILEKNNLLSFADSKYYTCTPEKHETLKEFDKETDTHIQQILKGTFEGLVTD